MSPNSNRKRKVELIQVLKVKNDKVLVKFKEHETNSEEVETKWTNKEMIQEQPLYKEYMKKKDDVVKERKRKEKDDLSKKMIRVKWNDEEVKAIQDGVTRLGKNWILIRNDPKLKNIFNKKRTAGDLKDKWRQLSKLEENKKEEEEEEVEHSRKK